MTGDAVERIEIVSYRPQWADEFAALADELRAALGPLAHAIHHIGSTAVPGLAAKDIIDVQVTVEQLDASKLRPAVESIGLAWREDIDRDHAPPGREVPSGELAKLYAQRITPRRVNCHFRLVGAFNTRYAVLFRDYLRAHRPTAAAYGAIKQGLASHSPTGIDLYYDVKDPLCDIIYEAAEIWDASG